MNATCSRSPGPISHRHTMRDLPTFTQRYCQKNNLSPDDFQRVIMARGLYLPARLLRPVIDYMWPRHFDADRDFIQGIAQLRHWHEFQWEANEFTWHPSNKGPARRVFRLRLSVRRLRRLVRNTFEQADPASVRRSEARGEVTK